MGLAQITKVPSAGRGGLTQVPYSRAWAHNRPALLNGAGFLRTHTKQLNRAKWGRDNFHTIHRREIICAARIKYSLKYNYEIF